jgi:phage head maturation protease
VGQVEGIALVYDVLDARQTTFARGCLTRTIRERVSAGKVKLYWDHGDAIVTGTYDTHLHIGVVRSLRDQQLSDGTWGAVFRADIFDTEPGREAHEYLKAVAVTGSETGVSIGMMTIPEATRAVIAGQQCARFGEVALREISITGESSVPGTKVTSVRAATVATVRDATVEPATEPAADVPDVAPVVEADPAPLTPDPTLNYDPLLRGICAAIGVDAFRLLTTGILSGDAEHRDSDATTDALRATASDATTLDSQPAAAEAARTDLASAEDRLAFVRANYQRLYP